MAGSRFHGGFTSRCLKSDLPSDLQCSESQCSDPVSYEIGVVNSDLFNRSGHSGASSGVRVSEVDISAVAIKNTADQDVSGVVGTNTGQITFFGDSPLDLESNTPTTVDRSRIGASHLLIPYQPLPFPFPVIAESFCTAGATATSSTDVIGAVPVAVPVNDVVISAIVTMGSVPPISGPDFALPTTTYGASRLTKNGSKANYPDLVISRKGNGVFGLPTSTICRRSDRMDILLFRAHLILASLAWAISVPDSGEGGLTGFDFPKYWVPEPVMHSISTPSPSTTTGFRMRLIGFCTRFWARSCSDLLMEFVRSLQIFQVPATSRYAPETAKLRAGPRLVFGPLCLFISSIVSG